MQPLLTKLQTTFPQLRFTAAKQFCWSPETREIFYDPASSDQKASWSLLHETGHALLEHTGYTSDLELLRLEVAAWEKARALAVLAAMTIDENHVQDCLDTYRDWLFKRSICPECRSKCLQQDNHAYYRCYNCHTVWRVSASRFCRAYRSTKNIKLLS